MDIDEPGVQVAMPEASTSSLRSAVDDEAAANATLARLEELTAKPYDYTLHLANIKAASTPDDREDARNFMAQMLPLTEELWLDWIVEKRTKFEEADATSSLEAAVEVLELYKRACNDYLSMRIRRDYANFVVGLWYTMRGYDYPSILEEGTEQQLPNAEKVNDVGSGVFTEDFVREELEQAVSPMARRHLTESHMLWRILHDFELDQLRRDSTPDAVTRMHAIYLERLAEPHIASAETHQLFSNYISTYANDTYETSMVEAQTVYSKAKAVAEVRVPEEDKIERSRFSQAAYKRYLAWEQEVKKPDIALVRTLFERAVKRCYYDTELWQEFIAFMVKAAKRTQNASLAVPPVNAEDVVDICRRAVRNNPASGELAASATRALEGLGDIEAAMEFATAQCARAAESSLFEGLTDEFTEVFVAKADLIRHSQESELEAGLPEELSLTLQQGISKVKELSKEVGDPRLRLERYLVRAYEKVGDSGAIEALYTSLAKMYPNSATVILARVEHALKNEDVEAARKLFANGTKRRLDYPEYLFESWVAFEHRDGTLATLEKALATVKHEMKFVSARRQKEAAKAMALAAESQAGSQAESTVQANTSVASANGEVETAPAIQGLEPRSTTKRQASEEPSQSTSIDAASRPTTKKAKQDHPPAEVKRDRENATVSVSGLSSSIGDAAIKRLFRDCGEVREIKIKTFDGQTVATVEFMSKDAVPAALTKDKKQLDGEEITVHPDWQSTLYVTNFPEDYDAADLQRLFEPYGAIFEVRWPSKRLKATRRFAYVQYTSQASAKDALVLHGRELPAGSGLYMQVKLSDPTRRLNRTDANANKKEIYVTGLPRFAKEADLRKLFDSFGTIKGARVSIDEQGNCKGFGFVDFETEDQANAALSMNNEEYKKRRLAVVLADGRVTNRQKPTQSGQGRSADLANRSIRVTKLPEQVQEAVLQQFFEKLGAVEAVQVHSEQGEATITFTNAADVGKLLLRTDPIVYENCELAVGPEFGDKNAAKASGSTGLLANPRGRGGSKRGAPSGRAGRARGSRLGIGASRPARSTTPAELTTTSGDTAASQPPRDAPSTGAPAGRSQADFRAFLSK